MPAKAKLILKNGPTFEGNLYGAETISSGEVVFTTGMVGYPESLTDPSFKDQILVITFPLVGNYGIPKNTKDEFGLEKFFESEKVHLKAVVVSEYSENFSHWNAQTSLSDFLKKWNIPLLSGIDTRALTQYLRDNGSQLGKIIPNISQESFPFYDPNKKNLVSEVGVKKPKIYENGPKTIIMIDCGVKNNTIRNFLKRNLTVIRVPWDYDFFEQPIINKKTGKPYKINGLFISNGPGDPAMLEPTINIIKKALDQKLPTFGICLGNQLIALAAGAKTYKMKFGNRGQNQPCLNLENNKCYITSQNHGFSIDPKTLPKNWNILFQNLNDKTIEGIRHKNLPFFSVQFHPEACPGPTDTEYLFDEFVKLL